MRVSPGRPKFQRVDEADVARFALRQQRAQGHPFGDRDAERLRMLPDPQGHAVGHEAQSEAQVGFQRGGGSGGSLRGVG
jgi:hypothetical protein